MCIYIYTYTLSEIWGAKIYENLHSIRGPQQAAPLDFDDFVGAQLLELPPLQRIAASLSSLKNPMAILKAYCATNW